LSGSRQSRGILLVILRLCR